MHFDGDYKQRFVDSRLETGRQEQEFKLATRRKSYYRLDANNANYFDSVELCLAKYDRNTHSVNFGIVVLQLGSLWYLTLDKSRLYRTPQTDPRPGLGLWCPTV